MKWLSRIFRICFVWAGVFCVASGDDSPENFSYSYHPRSAFILGQGYSPAELYRAFKPCYNSTTVEEPDGNPRTRVDTYLVQNSESVKTILGIDSRIEARYLMASGSVHFSLNEEAISRRDSITFVFLAYTEFSRKTVRELDLLPQYKELIRQGRMNEFEQECGSHVVIQMRRAARAAILITLTGVDAEEKSRLGLDVAVGGGVGPFSGSASVGIQNLVERSRREGRVQTQVVSTGGPAFSHLSSLVEAMSTEVTNFERMKTAMKTYLDNFAADNAAPVNYLGAPAGFGFIRDDARLWTLEHEDRLARLAREYREIKTLNDFIDRIMRNIDPRRELISREDLAALASDYSQLRSHIARVATVHSQCLATRDLNLCEVPELTIPLPQLPEVPEAARLISNREQRGWRSQLLLEGQKLTQAKVYLNDTLVKSFTVPQSVANPNVRETTVLSLERYWSMFAGVVRGNVVGRLVVTDAYNRTFTFVFHRAVFPLFGALEPDFEDFSEVGEL